MGVFNGIKRIAYDVLRDIRISTIHLPFDHNLYGPTPLWFEAEVFGGPLDGELVRYETEQEAIAGHAVVLERVQKATVGGAK